MSETVVWFSQKSQFSQLAASHVVYRGREKGNKCTPIFMKDKKKLSKFLSLPCYLIIIVDLNHESELKYLESALNKKEGAYFPNLNFCIALFGDVPQLDFSTKIRTKLVQLGAKEHFRKLRVVPFEETLLPGIATEIWQTEAPKKQNKNHELEEIALKFLSHFGPNARFEGTEAVTFIQQNVSLKAKILSSDNSNLKTTTIDRALGIGQLLLQNGYICHETYEKSFQNSKHVYFCPLEPFNKRAWKQPSEW